MSNTHHLSHGIIAAISVGTFLVLLLIAAWFWRRTVRRRAVIEDDPPPIAQPFSPPDPAQIGRFRLAQYTTAEKTNKYRQAYGFAIPEAQLPAQETDDGRISVEGAEDVDQPRRVRYRIYEDGGEVRDNEGGETNDNDDIISLPPVYDTLRRSPEQAHTPSPATSHPKP